MYSKLLLFELRFSYVKILIENLEINISNDIIRLCKLISLFVRKRDQPLVRLNEIFLFVKWVVKRRLYTDQYYI